jgi:hypothetical protein
VLAQWLDVLDQNEQEELLDMVDRLLEAASSPGSSSAL